MNAREAIYDKGDIIFPCQPPETHGPVTILVIFPDDPVDALDWDCESEADVALEVPM